MQGAGSYEDAHKIASRISTSALVKTALYGEDAKYDPVPFSLRKLSKTDFDDRPAGAAY